jgi:hypothetical protein
MPHDRDRPKQAPEAVLIVGVLAAGEEALRVATSLMEEAHGPVRMASGPVPFTWSRYYAEEMGPGLTRRFLAFERPIDPGLLRQTKLATVDLERGHAREGRRVFNLDPGYLTLSTLVVASTKDASYRVYLGDGIYAQPMLVYREGGFHPFDWTYPDYRDPAHLEFFEAVRRDARSRGVLGGRGADPGPGVDGG